MKFELNEKYVIKFSLTDVWTCVAVSPLGTGIMVSQDGKREVFVPAASTEWLKYVDPLTGDYYVLLWINVLEKNPLVQTFITADYTKYSEQKKRVDNSTNLRIVHDNHVIWSENDLRK